jgi:hypothetical protein
VIRKHVAPAERDTAADERAEAIDTHADGRLTKRIERKTRTIFIDVTLGLGQPDRRIRQQGDSSSASRSCGGRAAGDTWLSSTLTAVSRSASGASTM